MRLDVRSLAIVAVASSHLTAMAQQLLGLSLAPKLITVAEVWQNRSSGPIVQIAGSEAYQACLAEFARNTFFKALTESLNIAQTATNVHFNRRVQIPILSLPPMIHDRAAIATIKEAMIDIGFASGEELQHVEMPYAAHYAYELGTAKGLGLEEHECDWDMGVYEAVLVDYNSAILTMSLIDLAEHGCVTRGEVSVPELGENAIIGGSADTAQEAIVPEAQTKTHYKSIQPKLESFLSQELLLKNSASNTGSNWKPLRSDIRAIILSGDAPLEGFDHLRSLLRETFLTLPTTGWLKDAIDPIAMAAVGAAKRAKHLLHRPEDFHVHLQLVEHDHDEL